MAYVSKQWKDRQVEYPNRRTITHDDLTQEVVSVNRNEGTIYEAGDVLDSVNMNNLESRIAAGFNEKQNTLTAGQGITIENDVISATGGGGGASALVDLTDTDINSPTDKQALVYDAIAQKWKNGDSSGFALDKTATGSVVSFNDGADDLPVLDLTAQIVLKQTGTGDPSPSNVRPISGFTGVNVTRAGKNLITGKLVGGTIGGSGNIGEGANYSVYYGKVKAGVTYTISTDESSAVYAFYEVVPYIGITSSYDGQRVVSYNKTFTSPIDGYIAFRATASYTLAQLEVGSSATTYEAPTEPTPYSVTWQTEAGTVYFGYIDLTTGLLTVMGGHLLLKEQADLSFSRSVSSGYDTYYRNISSYASDLPTTGYTTIVACDHFKPQVSTAVHSIYIQNGYVNVRTANDEFQDASAFLSWVQANGIDIVYELATPQTYQLTPTEVKTLLGLNTIVADTGNVSVDYQTEQASDIIDLVGEGGASDLADLGDVDLNTPTDGQMLTYDATAEKWVNEDAPDNYVVAEKTVLGSRAEMTDSTLTVTDALGSPARRLVQYLSCAQINKPNYDTTTTPPTEDFGTIQPITWAWIEHVHGGTTDTYHPSFSTGVYGCEYDFISGAVKVTHDAMFIQTCTMHNTYTSVFAKAIDSKYIQSWWAFEKSSIYTLVTSASPANIKDHCISLYYGDWNGTTRLWAIWKDTRFTTNSQMTAWLANDHQICLVGKLQTPYYIQEQSYNITLDTGTNTFNSLTSSYFDGQIELSYLTQDAEDFISEFQAETGISDLNDTQILNPYNDQALLYDSTSGRWTNKAIPVPWVEVTGNLAVGSTSITLSDASITTDSTIDVYTDPELPHTAISVSTGSVTITFEAQQTIIAVKVRVS